MAITQADKRALEQLFEQYGRMYGGCREDYFACLYLSKKFRCQIQDIARQCAFGNRDYGVDAYYVDRDSRNLYLFQFKWSENHNLFRESLDRLAGNGMDRIFGDARADPQQNDVLTNLRADLNEYRHLIKRVLIHMVFKGELDKAENSEGLQHRRENLENKKYLVRRYLGDDEADLQVEFIAESRRQPPKSTQDTFRLSFANMASITTSSGQKTMHVGFVPLMDLFNVYEILGQKFLSRNIRSGLSANNSPNTKIREALGNIVLKQTLHPDEFSFNHNGVTLAAEHVAFEGGHCVVEMPRLLNGAQTITSLAKFREDNEGHPTFKSNRGALETIKVLAKIIVDDPFSEFVANVTICNNRQNPVEPWNLRANDSIQCDLHDHLRERSGIFYSRQENSFRNYSTEELEEMGYDTSKDIRIRPLAQTFLAMQGEIGRMTKLPDVFENQKWYEETFRGSYLQSDTRKIVIGYKVHLCLKSPMQRLEETAGQQIGSAISRAKNLVWALLIQHILNDGKLETLLEDYGENLVKQGDFREYLMVAASNRIRPILKELLGRDDYRAKVREEKYDFLRTKEVFKQCMTIANRRYNWTKKSF